MYQGVKRIVFIIGPPRTKSIVYNKLKGVIRYIMDRFKAKVPVGGASQNISRLNPVESTYGYMCFQTWCFFSKKLCKTARCSYRIVLQFLATERSGTISYKSRVTFYDFVGFPVKVLSTWAKSTGTVNTTLFRVESMT